MSIRFQCTCGREFKVPDSAAGKHAKCLDCGRKLTVPRLHKAAATAAGGAAAAPSARPGAPGRPAGPAGRPAAPSQGRDDVPVARLVPEDEVSMARLAEAQPQRRHPMPRRGPSLASVRVAVGIAVVVMLAVAADAIIALAQGVRGGAKGLELIHAAWLAALVVGFFIAAAAAQGSRLCIGVLLGGAVQGLFVNGPAMLILSTMDFTKKISPMTAKVLMLVGWAALALGAVYLVLLFGSGTRKHLSGHGGTVAGGAVVGLLMGWIVAITALPNPGLMGTRLLAQPGSMVGAAQAWKAPQLIGATGKKDIRVEMQNRVVRITHAFQVYISENDNYMPQDLGMLVGKEECKAETFVAPGSRRAVPEVDPKTHTFKGPTDIVYVLAGYHLFDLPDDADQLSRFIVLYSDPEVHFGDGAIVMRPPGRGLDLVQWLPKTLLDEELAYTRKWMQQNPPRPPLAKERPADAP